MVRSPISFFKRLSTGILCILGTAAYYKLNNSCTSLFQTSYLNELNNTSNQRITWTKEFEKFENESKNINTADSDDHIIDVMILDDVSGPGIIVESKGGLGNQLFKYASSLAAARKYNLPLYIHNPDLRISSSKSSVAQQYYYSASKSLLNDPSKRQFMLDLFNLPEGKWITENAWSNVKDTVVKFTCEELLYNKIPRNYKLLLNSDYCHSEKYFENVKEEIKEHLYPKVDSSSDSNQFKFWKDLIHKANSKEDRISLAIHIRRGDYSNRQYWITPIDYFQKGMERIKAMFPEKKTVVFVFSDDIEYAKKNLVVKGEDNEDEIHFVTGAHNRNSGNATTTSFEEFILMSMCKNMIISNSTFSWWAAYLKRQDGVIIAPKFHPKFLDHVKDEHHRKFKIKMWKYKYPKEWIQIDPYNGHGL